MRRILYAVGTALAAGALVGVAAGPSHSTVPGSDGRIVYVANNQVYTITASGTDRLKLTSSGKNFHPHWSPNGKRIAYVHQTSTGSRDVWVMASNGSNKQQVTHLASVGLNVVWRPDGRVLAFPAGDGDNDGDLLVQQKLKKVSAIAPFGSPTNFRVAVYNTDDGPCACPGPLWVDRYVAWSPDGRTIAVYNHDAGSDDDAIYVYDTTTRVADGIYFTGSEHAGYSIWSDLFFDTANQLGYVYEDMNENTGLYAPPLIRYSAWPYNPGLVSWRDYDRGPAESPSGDYWVVTNTSTGSPKLYIANYDGSGRRYLTDGRQADWQPLP